LWLYSTVKQHPVNELYDCFLSVPFLNHFPCQHGHNNSHHRCWIYWALNCISSRSCMAWTKSPRKIVVLERLPTPFGAISGSCTGCFHYEFREQNGGHLTELGKSSFGIWEHLAKDEHSNPKSAIEITVS